MVHTVRFRFISRGCKPIAENFAYRERPFHYPVVAVPPLAPPVGSLHVIRCGRTTNFCSFCHNCVFCMLLYIRLAISFYNMRVAPNHT